jgi:hypothetical protein
MTARKIDVAGDPAHVSVPVQVTPWGGLWNVKVAVPVAEATAEVESVSCWVTELTGFCDCPTI